VSALHSPTAFSARSQIAPSLLSTCSPLDSVLGSCTHAPCSSYFGSPVPLQFHFNRHNSSATTEHSALLCPYSASPFASSRFSCLLPRHPFAMTADRENYNTSSRAKRSLQIISRKRQGTRTPYSTRQTNQRHTRTTPQERTTYGRRTPAPPLDGERRNPAPPLDSERRVGNIND
jgi:hypothetical protein